MEKQNRDDVVEKFTIGGEESEINVNYGITRPAMQGYIKNINGKRFLDIGCGTGYGCSLLAEQGAKYILGIDSSEKMIATGKKLYAATENIKLKHSDAVSCTLKSSYYDYILSMMTLQFISKSNLQKVLDSSYTVLVSGGRCIISVVHPNFVERSLQEKVIFSNLAPNPDTGEMSCLMQLPGTQKEDISYHRSEKVYTDMFDAAGFSFVGSESPLTTIPVHDPVGRTKRGIPQALVMCFEKTE